ncbi:hypothetical protein PCANC_03923 [Puccinia coronata f. sp. avenae]|uniref:Uncharacterized protein n=1 Tax=Puccinia coronata f. sp. avenae TaxID=200324 RepID=A0A2N5W199_9BASI|nr:hypothetical protein PCANC_03923 [Puccinia coronata f. sp. avenae]
MQRDIPLILVTVWRISGLSQRAHRAANPSPGYSPCPKPDFRWPQRRTGGTEEGAGLKFYQPNLPNLNRIIMFESALCTQMPMETVYLWGQALLCPTDIGKNIILIDEQCNKRYTHS